jgi:hypothetical protein
MQKAINWSFPATHEVTLSATGKKLGSTKSSTSPKEWSSLCNKLLLQKFTQVYLSLLMSPDYQSIVEIHKLIDINKNVPHNVEDLQRFLETIPYKIWKEKSEKYQQAKKQIMTQIYKNWKRIPPNDFYEFTSSIT